MSINNNILLFLILNILLLPSFIYVGLSQSSLTLGLVVALFIFALFNFQFKIKKINIKIIYFYLFYLHYLLILIIYFDNIETKYFFSFFILIILLSCSIFFYNKILSIEDSIFESIIKKTAYVMLVIGLVSLIYKINFFNYNNFAKSIFPYSEPSHFVLSIGSIFLFWGLVSKTYLRLLLVFIIFIFAISYKSLLLIILSVMMSFVYYTNNLKKVSFMLILIFLISIYIYLFDENKYFIDRLDFTGENNNLTVLVYLQGIQEAYNNLLITNGIGIGFQRLGETVPLEISELIYKLSGEYKNRTDGGFLASKIVGELGILGIIFIYLFISQFIKSFLFIRKYLKYNLNINSKILFAHSVIICFFIEMFGRGYGYFSPGVFLLFTSILLIQNYNKNYK